MKTFLLSILFLVCSLSFYAANESNEKTYVIEIEKLTLNSVTLTWHRTDGTSEKNDNQPYTPYYVEYGIKGFERGKGVLVSTSMASFTVYYHLVPNTEYAFFIRKTSVSADSPVWLEEYNFKTPTCNTAISNIEAEMKYANGQIIKI